MLIKSPFRIKQSSNILLDKKITTALKFLHSVKETLYKNLDSHGFEHCKDIMDRKFDNLTSYDNVVQLSVELSSYTDAQLLGIENAAIQDAFGDFI